MITRRRDYSKQEPTKDARKLYIFCEGAGTEPDYFGFFEGLSCNLEVITIPPEDGTDPLKLMELAKHKLLDEGSKFLMDYYANDSVWFVIDTDTWEKEGKIRPLREFCITKNEEFPGRYSEVKPYSAWNVVQSNPCFEMWLYYHFFNEKPDQDVVMSRPTFKSFVNDSISGGFNFQSDPAKVDVAIENAKATETRNSDGDLALYSTEVYKLAEIIVPFVQPHLVRLKGKMM